MAPGWLDSLTPPLLNALVCLDINILGKVKRRGTLILLPSPSGWMGHKPAFWSVPKSTVKAKGASAMGLLSGAQGSHWSMKMILSTQRYVTELQTSETVSSRTSPSDIQ